MDSISLLHSQIDRAHAMLQGTIADLTEEQAHWSPGGKAVPAGATLAHIVLGEDFLLNMNIGQQPLAMGPFSGKMGVSEPPPLGGAWGEWAQRVKVDLSALNEYAQAVFKNTTDYISRLEAQDLEREIDLSSFGLGKMNLAEFISMIAVVHPSSHCGEISCMKGQQGAKGYPF